MPPSYSAAFVAVLLAVAAVQTSQAADADFAKLNKAFNAIAKKAMPKTDVAARERFLAEKSTACTVVQKTLDCSVKSTCDGDCKMEGGSCQTTDSSMTTLLTTTMTKLAAPMSTCSMGGCANASNTDCFKGDSCTLNTDVVAKAFPDDKAWGKIQGHVFICGSYNTEASCNGADKKYECAWDTSETQPSCGLADGGNMVPMLVKECGLTMPSGAAGSSVVFTAAMAIFVVLGALMM